MLKLINSYWNNSSESGNQNNERKFSDQELRLERTQLMGDLQLSKDDFAAFVEQQKSGNKDEMYTDAMPVVTVLCDNIYRCCQHGLKSISENESVAFFGLLKWSCARIGQLNRQKMMEGMDNAGSEKFSKMACQMATSTMVPNMSRDMRGFSACMRAANSLSQVHTDAGKARAFIRQALNTHVLHTCLETVLDACNEDLLVSYYAPEAIFRNEEFSQRVIQVVHDLVSVNFGFLINDPRLDEAPCSMPFALPLPEPELQDVKPRVAALIDPEDMIQGRFRLSNQDTESSLLAEKLVLNRQLGNDYNAVSGGNPLGNLLKKAQSSQKMDDATTAVMRFLEIGTPEYDVFGAPMIDVICNPFLCGMARFDTALGMPDVIEFCVTYLNGKLGTPGLFQIHLAAEKIMELRDAIEEIGGIHKNMAVDPHEIVGVLLQYLWELPESMFTEELWEAIFACGKLESEEERLRNLSHLVNNLPWYVKPTLERIIKMFARALLPQFTCKNGLDSTKLGLLLAPLLFRNTRKFQFSSIDEADFRKFPVIDNAPIRSRLPSSFYEEYDIIEAERVAAEGRALRRAKKRAQEGAIVLALLLENCEPIFKEFRKDQTQRRKELRKKVEALENIRERQDVVIDLKNEEHQQLLRKLWNGLLPDAETDAKVFESEDSDMDGLKRTELLLSTKRWLKSGFHTANPMGGFRGGNLLSLECMAFFVHEYPEKAKLMMRTNAEPGGTRYPFPVACINVMRMMATLLMVDTPPATASRLVLRSEKGSNVVLHLYVSERVSRSPFWRVFDDEFAFEKMQSMAFMLLDLNWTRSGATQMGFNPVLDSTRRQMGWLLEQNPKDTDAMWKTWMQARQQQAYSGKSSHYTKREVELADSLAETMKESMSFKKSNIETKPMSLESPEIPEDNNAQATY